MPSPKIDRIDRPHPRSTDNLALNFLQAIDTLLTAYISSLSEGKWVRYFSPFFSKFHLWFVESAESAMRLSHISSKAGLPWPQNRTPNVLASHWCSMNAISEVGMDTIGFVLGGGMIGFLYFSTFELCGVSSHWSFYGFSFVNILGWRCWFGSSPLLDQSQWTLPSSVTQCFAKPTSNKWTLILEVILFAANPTNFRTSWCMLSSRREFSLLPFPSHHKRWLHCRHPFFHDCVSWFDLLAFPILQLHLSSPLGATNRASTSFTEYTAFCSTCQVIAMGDTVKEGPELWLAEVPFFWSFYCAPPTTSDQLFLLCFRFLSSSLLTSSLFCLSPANPNQSPYH